MKFLQHLLGSITVRITTADPITLTKQCNFHGIVLYDINIIDELCIQIRLPRSKFNRLKILLNKRGDKYDVLFASGVYWKLGKLLHRPVLSIGIILILVLVLYTPSRVLFIRVLGNTTVDTALILESASNCGIRFGASRRHVRSEKVKNQLISNIPELEWVGINTDGCVATINVTERSDSIKEEPSTHTVSSIIASRDGVIVTCTVLKGTPICKAGQAVKEGELLVSGYTDCGICVQATEAKAEVLAQTNRQFNVLTPIITTQRGNYIGTSTQYSLKLGKKLIKFEKDSGIPNTTCVKIYKENHVVLPGGFQLPISLITEKSINYALIPASTSFCDWLQTASRDYVKKQMVAGIIVKEDIQMQSDDDIHYLSGNYDCIEMIGQTKYEEIIDNHGFD